MGAVEALLAKHCPDGLVEYRTLGEVCLIKNGRDYKHLEPGDIPVYGSGGVMGYVGSSAHDGPTVLIPRKGSLGNVFYVDGPVWTVDTIFYTEIDDTLIEPKFLFHCLSTMDLAGMNQAGGVPSQTQTALKPLPIPVPPLPVQHAVVEALSAMEGLQESLRDEEKARREQFEHYRRLVMDGAVRDANPVALGSVATVLRGASPRPIKSWVTSDPTGTPWIKIGDVPEGGRYVTGTAERIRPEGEAKSRVIEPGDFILSNSMSFGRPYISKIRGCIHDGWLAIKNYEEHYDPEFLYLLMGSSSVYTELSRRAGSGAVRNINADIVRSLVLPVPSLDVQRGVVEALAPFSALLGSLADERVARRQQFEHYRDRLLTFPERASVA